MIGYSGLSEISIREYITGNAARVDTLLDNRGSIDALSPTFSISQCKKPEVKSARFTIPCKTQIALKKRPHQQL